MISEIEKLGVELNDRQRDGLKIIFEMGKITNADYAETLKISRNTATNDLTELAKEGVVITHQKFDCAIIVQLFREKL